ncbi:hypothetical protein Curi_c14860 [Gottschalkia acidurici 9a]|uniref:DUF1648 domain-containing protein n=1 Tax=Gottschalkia acidurici (strain ATCC 7906 / DSM 604 / BCRC 14475 / CIP 104303 / KCTC 5404 / NCIMB 10678 / 9a) TaxID=1128398 RepID=K0B1E9_GOTA9|nr:hypothetical protein [Gottschalkia acidurici]AFS78496.1 hypothetical protein Curi_c14860 [Gottschalkia acidurici 9a]
MSKKKTIIISSFICVLPIMLGSILWSLLPEMLIRHFGPGSYSVSPKKTVIFLYPLLFLMLHFVVVFKSDWLNTTRNEKRYWYIPVLSSTFFIISFILSFMKS